MWKKVVLYNTTIDSFLRYGKKAITKMKAVFCFFEQKNNVVLLWRPHPLLEATIRSMRPDLLEEYLELTACYKNKGIGILDESPDLHRAIAISDAYYGDWSSLVDLYKVTGKPILIQNIEVMKEDILSVKWAFSAYTFQIYQDRIYAMAPKGDALLCKEQNGKLTILKHLKGGSARKLLFSMSIVQEGKIFFAPWNADSFLCYDIASMEVAEIPMEEPAGDEIFYLTRYGEEICAVGMSSMKVYRYDHMGNLFQCISPGGKERSLSAPKRAKTYGCLPFVDKNTNEFCIYHINTNQWNVYPAQKEPIQDFVYDGEWCWFVTVTGWLVKMDISDGVCTEETKITAIPGTRFLFDCGGKLLLLPKQGAVCIEVEKETMQPEKKKIPELEDGLQHYFSEITDTQILVEGYKKDRGWHLFSGESFWVYDCLEKTAVWTGLDDEEESCREELEKLYAEEHWTAARKRNDFLIENPDQSLNFLCRLLYAATEEMLSPVRLCGETIHTAMMQDI